MSNPQTTLIIGNPGEEQQLPTIEGPGITLRMTSTMCGTAICDVCGAQPWFYHCTQCHQSFSGKGAEKSHECFIEVKFCTRCEKPYESYYSAALKEFSWSHECGGYEIDWIHKKDTRE